MVNYKIILIAGAVIVLAALVFFLNRPKPAALSVASVPSSVQATPTLTTLPTAVSTSPPSSPQTVSVIHEPISNALARITKKPFGIYVTPQNSPVQPEKFTGYHTGVDFETTVAEQNIDVPISVICSGKLLEKKWATGYGGVAVEQCKIQNQDVTVIYGHLNIATVTLSVGRNLQAGDHLAMLGAGYSQETDGERKHLHLGIHKGTAVNILGYVRNKADLANWTDAQTLLQE